MSRQPDYVKVTVTVQGQRGRVETTKVVQIGKVNLGDLSDTVDYAVLAHEGRDAYDSAVSSYMRCRPATEGKQPKNDPDLHELYSVWKDSPHDR